MKVSKSLQTKLEDIFQSLDYSVRYEKGNFKSGYCLLESQNVIVINKFFPMESKVNTLIELLKQIDYDPDKLDKKQVKFIEQLRQTELQF